MLAGFGTTRGALEPKQNTRHHKAWKERCGAIGPPPSYISKCNLEARGQPAEERAYIDRARYVEGPRVSQFALTTQTTKSVTG
ncbi:hypothetical protein JTB14_001615 [Gonioctena quinquepunctata]|nr:hypothetical protein JTB14_001615 [Gonioctena quinquepunctata]